MNRPLQLLPAELAARWHITVGTLANWRSSGKGPRFIKFGRRVLYPLDSVEAYEKAHLMAAVHVPFNEPS